MVCAEDECGVCKKFSYFIIHINMNTKLQIKGALTPVKARKEYELIMNMNVHRVELLFY